ncbi:unnamed protein product [Arctia plantaginis]|uniref:Uncharacterized protein n=1 Tax=Arctia plantaginis TaxID=874455 RepID=A0A8S0Z5S8_ARCPL|nr:unnamed protein product [Arctia plantaginis]CAB3228280.1 unnamed protein product [Arctia plantaginis]
MRTEIIVCQRCCICIPLRYGLIVWAYARLVLAGSVLFGMSFTLNRAVHNERPDRTTDLVISSLIIILVSADIILGVIFIIGCHTKNPVLIKKYYYHNLCLLALLIPFCLYICGYSTYFLIKYKIPFVRLAVYILGDIIGCFTYIVIQVYVIFLIRSQFIKLNSGCQFRFENKVAEAACSLSIEDMTGENNTDYTKTRLNDDDDIGNFPERLSRFKKI